MEVRVVQGKQHFYYTLLPILILYSFSPSFILSLLPLTQIHLDRGDRKTMSGPEYHSFVSFAADKSFVRLLPTKKSLSLGKRGGGDEDDD